MRSLRDLCVFAALLAGAVPGPVRADSITQDRIVIQAADPSAVTVEHALAWTVGANERPTGELVFHLARGVTVTGAKADGLDLAFSSTRVEDSYLDRWTVKLPQPLPPGESREIALTTTIRGAESPGIRVDGEGGVLLAGSGWFPSVAPEADEILAHRVAFRLKAGQVGVAAGAASGGLWATSDAVRPFAAWGNWTRSEFRVGGVSCVAYRRATATGKVPGTKDLEALVYALDTGVGPVEGNAPWTFVDVGRGVLAGGFRTVLWDESAAARGGPLWNRDLAGALAASYWTESLRFTGPLTGLFSRSFPLFLGDAAAITLDKSDTRWKTEAALVGPRRQEFVDHLSADRVLRGLLPSSPDAPRLLRTRGALVVHMTADAVRSTAHFMDFLRQFRATYRGAHVDDTVFGNELSQRFGVRTKYLPQYVDTKNMPDFILRDHGPEETRTGDVRYRVEVENKGNAPDVAHISTFGPDGAELRTFDKVLQPGERGAVLFADADRIARVEVDARRVSLQPDLTGEVVEREIRPGVGPRRPAFDFERVGHEFRNVTGFNFDLDGVSIHDFDGQVTWYQTHHGPSGLLMFGNAKVSVAPPAPHTESFLKTMKRERMEFNTPALFVRFPPGRWNDIRAGLESAEVAHDGPSAGDVRFLYDYSFPAYYSEGSQAQIPPPGGVLVIISLGGVERRGFVREPKADGTVYARFWDQLRGSTLWEETR